MASIKKINTKMFKFLVIEKKKQVLWHVQDYKYCNIRLYPILKMNLLKGLSDSVYNCTVL